MHHLEHVYTQRALIKFGNVNNKNENNHRRIDVSGPALGRSSVHNVVARRDLIKSSTTIIMIMYIAE
jgi:hypothetical protein